MEPPSSWNLVTACLAVSDLYKTHETFVFLRFAGVVADSSEIEQGFAESSLYEVTRVITGPSAAARVAVWLSQARAVLPKGQMHDAEARQAGLLREAYDASASMGRPSANLMQGGQSAPRRPPLLSSLLEVGVRLQVPHDGAMAPYEAVRADGLQGPALEQMVWLLERAGDPRERLIGMARMANRARRLFVETHGGYPNSIGLDPVEIDLRVCFVKALASAVCMQQASFDERMRALDQLGALVVAEGLLGIPAPHSHVVWRQGARPAALAHLEGCKRSLRR